MRIYIFRSEANSGLRAFAGDQAGTKLPDRFRPWHAVGVVAPDKDPPHRLPRDEIERAIDAQGFQLWRLKPTAQPQGTEKPARAGAARRPIRRRI
jgi:hypothetical protein